jgi:hypothetical protein
MERLPPHLAQRVAALFGMAQRVWQMKRNMQADSSKPFAGENIDE